MNVNVAVRHGIYVPLLVGPAVELPLIDGDPFAGRVPGVVEHLAAGHVDDVIPREHLPALEGLAIQSLVASPPTGHRPGAAPSCPGITAKSLQEPKHGDVFSCWSVTFLPHRVVDPGIAWGLPAVSRCKHARPSVAVG